MYGRIGNGQINNSSSKLRRAKAHPSFAASPCLNFREVASFIFYFFLKKKKEGF